MAIHGKTFTALMGDKPPIKDRAGNLTGKLTGKVHDGDGLWLIIGEKSQRSWLYRWTPKLSGGHAGSINLGSAHKVDLPAARVLREGCEAMLKAGTDPRTDRKQAKVAAKTKAAPVKRLTVFEIAQLIASDLGNKEGPRDPQKRVYWANQLLGKHTAGLGDKAPAAVTRDDVVACLKAILLRAPDGEQARRVLVQLKQVFEWCAAPGRGYLAEDALNVAVFKGRAESLIAFLPEKRTVPHASIPWQAIRPVVAALRAKGAVADLAVEWTLLSATRVGMTLEAEWSEIDLTAKRWTIPALKMKESDHGDHVVPLTPRHLEILAKLAPEGAPASGLMFPAERTATLGCDQLQDALRAAYPDLIRRKDGSFRQAAPHGLRATFRTWSGQQCNKAGLPLYSYDDLELCLAHVVGDSAKRSYISESNIEARRTILTAWAKFLATPVIALARAA